MNTNAFWSQGDKVILHQELELRFATGLNKIKVVPSTVITAVALFATSQMTEKKTTSFLCRHVLETPQVGTCLLVHTGTGIYQGNIGVHFLKKG